MKLLAFSILLASLFCAAATDSGVAGVEFPRPRGPHAIGTATLAFKDSRRNRELLITVWYPAAASGSAIAPYMDLKTAAAIAAEWILLPGFERSVGTHGSLRAPMAGGPPFPVALLEHGSGVVPAIYTGLAEELASAGFVVVATNHPPDSLTAVYPDGHEVKGEPYWPLNADRRTQGIAIGKFAEDVLVADVRFVLDQLQQMNTREDFWKGRLDLSRIGIVGHSMGGTTASLAAKEEDRIAVAVNLDGSTYPGMNADVRPIPIGKPLLFMVTEEHASDKETHGREYVGSAGNTYYVVVRGSEHMIFSDARLLSTRFSATKTPDNAAYRDAVDKLELTRTLVEEFLGKYLKGSAAPALDALVSVDKK